MKDESIKELVLARLEVLPSDANVSIGSYGELSRDEMITHVKKGDEIGNKITQIEMEFLRQLKNGVFYEELASHQATV